MILVDTSAWIEFFRGSGSFEAVVDGLLDADEVALCGPVVTELRRGIRSPAERAKVIPLLDGCHLLAAPERIWDDAGDLGYFLGRRGAAVKTLDLLIAAYAIHHAVPILTADNDFALMKRAGLAIRIL